MYEIDYIIETPLMAIDLFSCFSSYLPHTMLSNQITMAHELWVS